MSPSIVLAATPPEPRTLSPMQHDLIMYAIVVAGLALFASFVHSWNSHSEVSSRYRTAIFASMCITGVAAISYFVIFTLFRTGYVFDGGQYAPTPDSLLTLAPRYMDWSVTVPLLTVELLAVTTLTGRKLSALRATTIPAAFLMIITGYFGSQAFSSGGNSFWLWLWFAISCVFFVYLYVALIPPVLASLKALPAEAGRALGLATTVLLVTFLVYPVVYLIPIFFAGAWWTTSMQLAYSAADVVAKVGFGMLIHKVAKLRTAADVADADDTHPEPVWVNSVHYSDGVQPVQRPFGDGDGRALEFAGVGRREGATETRPAHREVPGQRDGGSGRTDPRE